MGEEKIVSEEEKKKLYVYVLVASLLSGGGSTGLQLATSKARSNPFTGDQGAELRQDMNDKHGENLARINQCTGMARSNSVRLTEVERNRVLKENFVARCEAADKRIAIIESHDERMGSDIRELYKLTGKQPPPSLLKRVAALEIWREHLSDEHKWIVKQLRVQP